MRLTATALGLALAFAPVSSFAHGELPPASHGGLMQEAGEMYLELVVKGADVTVYVLDEARKPVPGTQASGTATILVDGKSHKVELKAAEGNSLHAVLPVEATGRVVATVSLKVGGRTASARFMPTA
jgi:ABC-type glycerol-3-phosphate transport system substrate-binding protein